MRDGIQLSEAISGDGAAIFRHACGLGLEGIVSKRIGSRYVSGRTRAWLKTKNPSLEFEAIVTEAVDISAFAGHVRLAARTYLVTIVHEECGAFDIRRTKWSRR